MDQKTIEQITATVVEKLEQKKGQVETKVEHIKKQKKPSLKIKPVEPLELEFPDGTVKTALFSQDTFMLMQEEFGDLLTQAQVDMHRPFHLAAKILYCGMKLVDTSTTYEEAEAIVLGGGVPLLAAIFDEVADLFEDVDPADLEKKVQELKG